MDGAPALRLVSPDGTAEVARIRWVDGCPTIDLHGEELTGAKEVGANGQHDAYTALRRLAQRAKSRGWRLVGCASCERFRFSGMTRDMSGGSVGYCGLVGFRNARAVVSIGHGCGEHCEVAGWPDDDAASWEARLAIHPKASRLPAFEGCLLGLAVGDAIGFPCEFRTRAIILESFGPDGVTDLVAVHDRRWPSRPMILGRPHPVGTYSDDTQMSIAVAEALIDGSDELDALMKRMAARFVAWAESPDNDRAPGATCLRGCENLARDVPWQEAGVAASKGCGSAMRVAPIGLRFHHDRSRLLEVARASSLLTHGHDAAIESAAAAALLVAMALEKATPRAMYDALMKECAPRSPDFAACLGKLPALITAPPEVALSERGLGLGWVAEEAVASALYCFARAPTDFTKTVLAAANTDGDSDSIACIAGGISGAFNGVEAIPASWRDRVENATMLRALAAGLRHRT
jgi:ADP-ribosylglycohydrolase